MLYTQQLTKVLNQHVSIHFRCYLDTTGLEVGQKVMTTECPVASMITELFSLFAIFRMSGYLRVIHIGVLLYAIDVQLSEICRWRFENT